MTAARTAVLIFTLGVLAMWAVPAPASAAPRVIGFGEQNPEMFTDARWQALGTPHVRVIIGWDALHSGWQRRELDAYMTAANAAGAQVLLSFGRSRHPARKRVLPSVARFRAEFRAIRRRYPSIRELSGSRHWNSQLIAFAACRVPSANL